MQEVGTQNDEVLAALRTVVAELVIESAITTGWLRSILQAGGMTRAEIEAAYEKARAEHGPAIRASVELALPAVCPAPGAAPADVPRPHRQPDPSAN